MFLQTPIERLKGVTPKVAKRLRHLGIATVRGLLFHFPSRYHDFTNTKKIAEIQPGETATVRVRLRSITATRAWQRRMSLAEAVVEDASGKARAVWFNQPYLARTFIPGETLHLAGKLMQSKRGLYFANPVYERIGKKDEFTHTAGLVPVYPETTGLTSRWLRYLVKQVIPDAAKVPESLPDVVRKRYQFPKISDAISAIHFPKKLKDADAARRRFSFEELLLIQLRVRRDRQALESRKAPEIPVDLPLIQSFVSSLPFPLTNAQRKAAWEIVNDMKKGMPMNRLLEGDVGSGKTVVAALVALNAVKAGHQVAYLAPTEILALQHFSTFQRLLAPFDISLGLLTSAQKKLAGPLGERAKINIPALAAGGAVSIVIGTHAVIQDKVKFQNLGLVVVDEQHRFGVAQRAHLEKQARLVPHFLSMTATPIPRTLSLTVYGDLDVSLLDQMPSNRKSIVTKIVPNEKRREAYAFMRDQVRRGRQIFVICPRIEVAGHDEREHSAREIANEEVKAVKTEYEKFAKEVFPELRVRMLHGKMKAREKEEAMKSFKDHAFDILVSTSVVEVGVDVPNATVMLIDGAEKFGLAQIHQFRGRVGRGEHQSYCFLMTANPDAENSSRLKAVVSAKNGFELAEMDLKIRGPGDFFGTRQSGIPPFAYGAFTDMKMVQAARETAEELTGKSPDLSKYPELKKRLAEFESSVHWE